MNKTLKTVALFSVLSLMAVGCQKETIVEPNTEMLQTLQVRTVTYTIDGMTQQIVIQGDDAWMEFLRQMAALAISNRSENLPNSDVKRKIINVPISESTLYDVKVYPNPTTDILSINIGNLNDKPASIQILDIFGRVMQSVGECLNSDIQLNISHLPSGCYYVVTTIGKEKDYKCIIKQ